MSSNTLRDVDGLFHKFAGCGFPHPHYMYCEWCDHLPEAKDQLYAAMVEVIGKYELPEQMDSFEMTLNEQNHQRMVRDRLRKEQLERLNKVFGKDK